MPKFPPKFGIYKGTFDLGLLKCVYKKKCVRSCYSMPLDCIEPILLGNALLYSSICILMNDKTALIHSQYFKIGHFREIC